MDRPKKSFEEFHTQPPHSSDCTPAAHRPFCATCVCVARVWVLSVPPPAHTPRRRRSAGLGSGSGSGLRPKGTPWTLCAILLAPTSRRLPSPRPSTVRPPPNRDCVCFPIGPGPCPLPGGDAPAILHPAGGQLGVGGIRWPGGWPRVSHCVLPGPPARPERLRLGAGLGAPGSASRRCVLLCHISCFQGIQILLYYFIITTLFYLCCLPRFLLFDECFCIKKECPTAGELLHSLL